MEFHDSNDLKKVQDGCPLSFNRYLFCLTSFNHNLAPQYIPFNKELFWVQLHQLPLEMMNWKYGEFMGEFVGEVEEVDVDKDGVGLGPSLKVRVWIDITKPLMRGYLITLEDQPHWIHLKNERLPNFYFKSGTIKHAKLGCVKGSSSSKMHESGDVQYGAWLRASPTKIPWKSPSVKSHYGSSSFKKNHGSQEEIIHIDSEHVDSVPIHNLVFNFHKRKWS